MTEPLALEPPGVPPHDPHDGAMAVFHGLVRGDEGGQPIEALEYQAYQPMAERELQRIVADLCRRYPCNSIVIRHRLGLVRVGEVAILVRVTAPHRAEVFGFLQEFMGRLKQDVPIWKVRAVAAPSVARAQ